MISWGAKEQVGFCKDSSPSRSSVGTEAHTGEGIVMRGESMVNNGGMKGWSLLRLGVGIETSYMAGRK